MNYSSYPKRTFCDVLAEIRKCHKTSNYSYMPGLVEELQTIGNRMEAHLDQKREYFELRDECRKLRKKLKGLKSKLSDSTDDKDT